jgi:shikimate dehydrogenase
MNHYGLIGQSLEHSFSKTFFTNLFTQQNIEAQYQNYNLANEKELATFLSETNCNFCNITMPYKQIVHTYLDAVSEVGLHTEAINCIKKDRGRWIGTNTDVIGFQQSIVPLLKPHHQHALIIGNGGAAQAVKYVLRKLNIPFIVVARSAQIGCIGFADLTEEIILKYSLIINTTPLGMHPNTDASPPIPYQFITSNHLLYDLIYNPQETLFLKNGKANGAVIKNGLEMLELQALAAWDWWHNTDY